MVRRVTVRRRISRAPSDKLRWRRRRRDDNLETEETSSEAGDVGGRQDLDLAFQSRHPGRSGFIGAGVAAVAVAAWQVYVHFHPGPPSAVATATPSAPMVGAAEPGPSSVRLDPTVVAAHAAAEQHALGGETDALNGIAQKIDDSNRANGVKPAKP